MSVRRFAAAVVLSLLGSCYPYQEYYFVGHVYDGATGTQLKSYTINIQYMTTTVSGTVDGTGYYNVGPIPPYQDFIVNITSSGYRPLMSPNQMHPDPATKTQESFYYDAYLFPTDVQTPAASISINELGSMTAPSGNLRLQPTDHSATYGLTPVDIGADAGTANGPQVWFNANDLQAATFSQAFMSGTLSIPAGSLVWGVKYNVTIYNVTGCAEFDSPAGAPYVAGVVGNASYNLTPLVQTPVSVVFNSGAQPGVLTPSYTLTIIFNQPVQVDPTIDPNSLTFLMNSNFSITSATTDVGSAGNVLNTAPTNGMPFDFDGVDYSVSNNTLTFTWNQTSGLMSMDSMDAIYSVTYGGLGSFPIMSVSNTTAASVSLSSLLGGAGSVTVVGIAEPAR